METAVIVSKPQALTGWADVPRVIEQFAYNTEYADVKPATRSLNERILTMFFEWVQGTGRVVSALTIADLIAYKEELLHVGNTAMLKREPDKAITPLSPLTVASYINSLRRFYEWAESVKLYPNIAKGLKAPKRVQTFQRQPLQVAQVGNLLKYERANQSPRDYAIINLMLRTGLRTVEVVRANVGDITYMGNQRILKVWGKGRDGKDNFVILTDAAYLPILEYLNGRPDGREPGAPLFTSESNSNGGERLTTRTISKIARAGLDAIGLDNKKIFTAHSLRHTAGTNILRAGGTLEQAQMSLRHANPATTEIYARMALQERRFTEGGELVLDKLYNNL